jgi:hypothetical protein
MSKAERSPTGRRYPAFYEKLIPVALVVIGVAILALLIITVAVALGLFPGS